MSLFLFFQLLFHECSVHFFKAISSEADIDVHRDGNIGVAKEPGEDFDVNALVVAVCGERMSESGVRGTTRLLDFDFVLFWYSQAVLPVGCVIVA